MGCWLGVWWDGGGEEVEVIRGEWEEVGVMR